MAQTTATAKPPLRIQPPATARSWPRALPAKERYLDVEIGDKEIRMLRQLIECDGVTAIAEAIGVDVVVVLRVGAGLLHTCRPKSQLAMRAFFASGTIE